MAKRGLKRGPSCKACSSPDIWRAELLIAGGASIKAVADKLEISPDSLWRHWHRCVTPDAKAGYLVGPAQLATLHETAAKEGASVIDHLKIVRTSLMASLVACSEASDSRGVAIVSAQLIAVLERIGKITGEIAQIAGSVTNINVAVLQSPEFMRAQAAILRALASHPAARADVVTALRALDAEATTVDVAPALPLPSPPPMSGPPPA